MIDRTQGTDGYRAATDSVALLEDERFVFEFRGSRAVRVVNGLVTNALEGLSEGIGAYAFALSAKGRPLAEMRVLPAPGFEERARAADTTPGAPLEERLWVDVPGEAAVDFGDLLRRSVPPIFATFEMTRVKRLSLLGPSALEHADGVLQAAGIEGSVPPAPLASTTVRLPGGIEGLLVRREAVELQGIDLYLDADVSSDIGATLAGAVEQLGGARCSAADWEILRVERGLPRFGAEITADNLPQETGQTDRAVSFEKGCYTGQEVVARIHYRGHVNRELRGLRGQPLDGAGSDETGLRAGAALYANERSVGDVATVVDSPRFGTIALGYVRSSVEPGTALGLAPGGAPVIHVAELPFT